MNGNVNCCRDCNGYFKVFGGFCEKKHRQVSPDKKACNDKFELNLNQGKLIDRKHVS